MKGFEGFIEARQPEGNCFVNKDDVESYSMSINKINEQRFLTDLERIHAQVAGKDGASVADSLSVTGNALHDMAHELATFLSNFAAEIKNYQDSHDLAMKEADLRQLSRKTKPLPDKKTSRGY